MRCKLQPSGRSEHKLIAQTNVVDPRHTVGLCNKIEQRVRDFHRLVAFDAPLPGA